MLAALWQHEAIDQIRPMKDAMVLAGTAFGLSETAFLSSAIALRILAALDLVTLNL